MAVKLIGTSSAVEVDSTAAKELMVASLQERLAVAPKYFATPGALAMGTLAAGTVVGALNNPTGSGKDIYILRADFTAAFVGTAAATLQALALSRATGTAGGGSSNISGASIPKRDPSAANSIATFYRGPTAITGLTADTPSDFSTVMQGHQVGQNTFGEFLMDAATNDRLSEPLKLVAATSLILITRLAAAVAGEHFCLNLAWCEI